MQAPNAACAKSKSHQHAKKKLKKSTRSLAKIRQQHTAGKKNLMKAKNSKKRRAKLITYSNIYIYFIQE